MRWYHAVIIAAGLAASGALVGGIYQRGPEQDGRMGHAGVPSSKQVGVGVAQVHRRRTLGAARQRLSGLLVGSTMGTGGAEGGSEDGRASDEGVAVAVAGW